MKTIIYRLLSLSLMSLLLGCHSPSTTSINPNATIFTKQQTLEQNWLTTF